MQRYKLGEDIWQVKSAAREAKEEKGEINRHIGKLIGENLEDKQYVEYLRTQAKPSWFRGNVHYVLKKLPPKIASEIKQAIKEAEGKEDYTSILKHIKNYLERRYGRLE